MKVAVTGHSKGIGKGLFDKLQTEGHDVIGFSRSNGYNLLLPETVNNISNEIKDCNVFINNALPSQLEMFNTIFNLWQNDETKTIVNIVSFFKYRDIVPSANEYSIKKNQLYKTGLKPVLSSQKKCRLISINPGWIDTDMTKNNNVKKMSADECANIIYWAINQPQHIEIGELSFWLTNSL